MEILVCIKRVPDTGARIVLTADEQEIETRNLGFTISPHEECAVEEAIRLVEQHGGKSTVLTLGPEAAAEQLRHALAMGVEEAFHLETDGQEWDAQATAGAITAAIQSLKEAGTVFDVLLFGNEAADTAGYQVGVRVAHALDLPCVTGIKALEIRNGTAVARREVLGGWEIFELFLPAVFTVKEGINVPRYPTLRGRMTAKKKQIGSHRPQRNSGWLEKVRLRKPEEQGGQVQILGEGPGAVAGIIEVLTELGVMES